jgi:hypothetical protein
MAKPQTRIFGFLSLASETRNKIYELIFEHYIPLNIADTDSYGVLLHRYTNDGNERMNTSSMSSSSTAVLLLTLQNMPDAPSHLPVSSWARASQVSHCS